MAEAEPWRPLSQRHLSQPPTEEAPYEGVPAHLTAHLIEWLGSILEHGYVRPSEIALRLRLPLSIGGTSRNHLLQFLVLKEEALLDAVDLVTGLLTQEVEATRGPKNATVQRHNAFRRVRVEELDALLILAGSAWRVAPTGRGLERRLDENVVQAARQVMAPNTSAAEHLSQAWQSAYGRNPDASRA